MNYILLLLSCLFVIPQLSEASTVSYGPSKMAKSVSLGNVFAKPIPTQSTAQKQSQLFDVPEASVTTTKSPTGLAVSGNPAKSAFKAPVTAKKSSTRMLDDGNDDVVSPVTVADSLGFSEQDQPQVPQNFLSAQTARANLGSAAKSMQASFTSVAAKTKDYVSGLIKTKDFRSAPNVVRGKVTSQVARDAGVNEQELMDEASPSAEKDSNFEVGQDSTTYLRKFTNWVNDLMQWCFNKMSGKKTAMGHSGVVTLGEAVNNPLQFQPARQQSSKISISIMHKEDSSLDFSGNSADQQEALAAPAQGVVPLMREASAKLPFVQSDAPGISVSSKFSNFSEEQRTKLAALNKSIRILKINSQDDQRFLDIKSKIPGADSITFDDIASAQEGDFGLGEFSSAPTSRSLPAGSALASLFGPGGHKLRKAQPVSKDLLKNEPKTIKERGEELEGFMKKDIEKYQFKSPQEGFKASEKAVKAAIETVQAPIRRAANTTFETLWPEMLHKYESDRKIVNRAYDAQSIEQFKKLQKTKFVDEAASNADVTQVVDEANKIFKAKVNRANAEMKASRKTSVTSGAKTNLETADMVRRKAENNIRDSMVQQRVDNIVDSWMDILKEDYDAADAARTSAEGGPQGNSGFKKALDEEKNKLRMKVIKDLTEADKLAIKEQANNIVTKWEVEQAKTPEQRDYELKSIEVQTKAIAHKKTEILNQVQNKYLSEKGRTKKSDLTIPELKELTRLKNESLIKSQSLIQEAGTQAVASRNLAQSAQQKSQL